MNIFYGEEINEKKIPMNKRIYLFEDIDSILDVLKDREMKTREKETASGGEDQTAVLVQALVNKKCGSKNGGGNNSNDKLNLGFFLNLIDGVLETPGRILIISTNYPEKLDRALIRPGRIDMKIHMEKCSTQMIYSIIRHYYCDDIREDIGENVLEALYSKEITPAELYQICFKYKTYSEFKRDVLEELDVVFNKFINREEEEKLKIESKIVLQNSVNTSGVKRRNVTRLKYNPDDIEPRKFRGESSESSEEE
jgi:SpoVK/Ycf46/Vps4 family AAA+-type ATPase